MSPPTHFDHEDHSYWMTRCLALARQAAGQTAPNPMVGSVILSQGQVVGEGFHPGAGQPHAEVFALRQAGDRAAGATLYVNLEPCNHTGRTPPCTEAIIQAGIRRVIAGMVDPDPRVAGSGLERLRQAGLEVIVGVEAAACERLNEGFLCRVTHQRPLGILKYAMTLDGKIATSTGHSQWVTGALARAEVHRLRALCDAVVVGGNTVRCDNPQLTTHGQSSHNPRRVVMSRGLDLPLQAHLWDTQTAPTLVFTSTTADAARIEQLTLAGVEVRVLADLTPARVTGHLYDLGCATVLWECGGTLAAQALRDRTIDKIWAFVAPKLVGGPTAPTPLGDLGITQMSAAITLESMVYRSLGEDLLIEGYLGESKLPSAEG
jgi:diaminohydroxyphosphoribosylaminopyrimidine deaminase / 5-amino-6-(5-phosphoribosylamino)uracil reductase